MRTKRGLLIGGVAVLVLFVLGAIAVSLAVRSHQAPPSFALSSPKPSGSASVLAGRWTVGPGSEVGYRAKEKFINQPAETEAVARTSKVTGSLVVEVSGGEVTVSRMTFTVDLASLTSQDKYANYQVYQRDFFVRSIYLQTQNFPNATFTADKVSLTAPTAGQVAIDVPGKLTVHGVSNPVTAHVQAQQTGLQAQVVGAITVDMRDFGIAPPDISFTRAEPGGHHRIQPESHEGLASYQRLSLIGVAVAPLLGAVPRPK